jgi:hypothetical protein
VINRLGNPESFILEIGEDIFVEGKLPLEGPVSHPAAPLKHSERLVKDLFTGLFARRFRSHSW